GYLIEATAYLTDPSEPARAAQHLSLHAASFLLVASVIVEARSLLPDLMRRCAEAPPIFSAFGSGASDLRSLARVLGEAAVLVNLHADSRADFARALP